MEKEQIKRLESQLKNCQSMDQMLAVLNSNFVLSACKPSSLVRNTVASELAKAMDKLNPPIRPNGSLDPRKKRNFAAVKEEAAEPEKKK